MRLESHDKENHRMNVTRCVRAAALAFANLAAPLALAGTEPWTPPAAPAPAVPANPAGPLDPSRLPDIGGVHIGQSSTEVTAILQKLHPGAEVKPIYNGQGVPPAGVTSSVGTSVPTANFDNVWVNYTFDSAKQVVDSVSRQVYYPQPIAREKYIAAARQKYGPETLSIAAGGEAKNDATIDQMYWLFDESGHVIHPGNFQYQTHSPYGCQGDSDSNGVINMYRDIYRSYAHGDLKAATYCDSVITLLIKMPPTELLPRVDSIMIDFALARRSAIALGAAQKAQAQQQQQQEIRNANQAKPNL
jgi:hypothetical protein